MTLAVMLALLCAAPANAAEAPGAPGAVANWTAGDKDGFGSARPLASKVWFTLQGGELTEVYAPDLGTPSFRDLQFVVSDGKTFSERETDVARHTTRLADPRSLTYRQYIDNLALAPDEDVRDRPGALRCAHQRAVRVADRQAVPAVRARRPRAVEHGRRRQRERHDRVRQDEREHARDHARAHEDFGRLHGRQRRLDRPARRLHDGLDLRQRRDSRQCRPDRGDIAHRPQASPGPHGRARVRRQARRRRRHGARGAPHRLRHGRRPLRARLARLPAWPAPPAQRRRPSRTSTTHR